MYMYMVPQENLVCAALANRSDNGEFVQKLVDQMAAAIIPNLTSPNTSVDLPTADFPGGPLYSGKWRGSLHGGGAKTAVSLEIDPGGSVTLLKRLNAKHHYDEKEATNVLAR